jgi:hypothetical protein
MVTIVKCRCGDEVCNTYGLSDGDFYIGNGWEKKRAQEYADAINIYDADRKLLAAMVQVGREQETVLDAGKMSADGDPEGYGDPQ